MKKRQNNSNYLFILISIFLIIASSCEKDDDVNNGQQNLPVLSTAEVTEINITTATSGGNIVDDGGRTVIARGVCWSITADPTINDNKTEDGVGAGTFVSRIDSLEPNTTYFLRAYATNSAGTGYGSAMSFTTQSGPVLSTTEVTEISLATATSGGNIVDDGGTTVTARGVCWSTTADPTINDNKTEDGTGIGIFISSITGLEQNTTYYLRAYATNSKGTAYGGTMSFTTQEAGDVFDGTYECTTTFVSGDDGVTSLETKSFIATIELQEITSVIDGLTATADVSNDGDFYLTWEWNIQFIGNMIIEVDGTVTKDGDMSGTIVETITVLGGLGKETAEGTFSGSAQ